VSKIQAKLTLSMACGKDGLTVGLLRKLLKASVDRSIGKV
jgi:hypothetical protein